MKRARNLVIVLVALAVLVGLAVFASHRNGHAELSVATQKIVPASFTVKLPENGVVMRPRTATIPALIAGNIDKIYVRAGQPVTAGELLATVDDPTLLFNAAGSRADYLSA